MSTVWSNTSKKNSRKLKVIQNFACRIILGLKKFDHISGGLKSLGWFNVCVKLSLNGVAMFRKCFITYDHLIYPLYLNQDLASAKDPVEMTLTLT